MLFLAAASQFFLTFVVTYSFLIISGYPTEMEKVVISGAVAYGIERSRVKPYGYFSLFDEIAAMTAETVLRNILGPIVGTLGVVATTHIFTEKRPEIFYTHDYISETFYLTIVMNVAMMALRVWAAEVTTQGSHERAALLATISMVATPIFNAHAIWVYAIGDIWIATAVAVVDGKLMTPYWEPSFELLLLAHSYSYMVALYPLIRRLTKEKAD